MKINKKFKILLSRLHRQTATSAVTATPSAKAEKSKIYQNLIPRIRKRQRKKHLAAGFLQRPSGFVYRRARRHDIIYQDNWEFRPF